MKTWKQSIVMAIAVLLLTAPFSYAGGRRDQAPAPRTQGASSPQTSAAQPATPSNPYFTGDGGKGRSITILPPRGVGLAANQAYLPDFVANELLSNFSTFSAMTLFDRVNNQKQYDELLSGIYDDNDAAGLDLGHLTSTEYMLLGDITRTSTGFALQLTVNRNNDKTTAATYSTTVAIAELDNLTGIRRASLDLLQKMGIQVTERTRTELTRAAETNHVNAQTAMAQGIVAQRGGTVVEALSSFIQANNYDSSVAEAASRLNILSANISSGNIGENVRNDLQWRDQWVARLQECEAFYANYLKEAPPYYLVYSPNITQGDVNYQARTVALTVESIAAYPDIAWFSTLNQVVKTVKQGLTATNRAAVWGLDNWPEQSLTAPNPFATRIPGLWVEMEILNAEGKSIAAKATEYLPYGWEVDVTVPPDPSSRSRFAAPPKRREVYARPVGGIREVVFPAADPNAITDRLSVRITAIDGVPAETAARQKRINILTPPQYAGLPNAGNTTRLLEAGAQSDAWTYFRVTYKRAVADIWVSVNDEDRRSIVSVKYGTTSINEDLGGDLTISVMIPNSVTHISDNVLRSNRLITIGANVNFQGAPTYFTSFYNQNGRKAGTYTYNESSKTWSYRAR